MAERKAFNFYASFFDVYKQLKTDKDKVAFIEALLEKQFYGIDPEGLTGMALFAYESQKQVISQQVTGWEKKTKTTLSKGVSMGGSQGGSVQGEEKEEEEEKEKEEVKGEWTPDIIGQLKPTHQSSFLYWMEYRKEIKKPIKVKSTLKALVKKFNSHSVNCCDWVVNHSIENNYQGLFWDKYTEKNNKGEDYDPINNLAV